LAAIVQQGDAPLGFEPLALLAGAAAAGRRSKKDAASRFAEQCAAHSKPLYYLTILLCNLSPQ
jgi:hypothetical protein